MTQADEIRQYVLDHYLKPARMDGEKSVQVRAGDVHKSLGLADRLPAVCSALGTIKFQEMACVELENRNGPSVSTTTTFIYRIL
jgi:5-methylcytosine-specific restriction protein B